MNEPTLEGNFMIALTSLSGIHNLLTRMDGPHSLFAEPVNQIIGGLVMMYSTIYKLNHDEVKARIDKFVLEGIQNGNFVNLSQLQ